MLEWIRQLYDVEDRAREWSVNARRELRARESNPVLDRIEAYLAELARTVLPKSSLAKAVTYARNQWEALRRYTEDGRLTIDNNVSERTLSGKGKKRPEPSLFDPPRWDEPADEEPVLVSLKDIRLERLRDFGDVWLAWGLWRLLGLDVLLEDLMHQGREEVPWSQVAAILVMARLCEPSSELHIETTWYRRTALEDLLGVPVEKVHTDRLYGGLDQLLPHKESVEKHLKRRLGDLFDLKYDLLLYDIRLAADGQR